MINYALFIKLHSIVSSCSDKYKTKKDFFYFSTIDTQDYIDYPKLYSAISQSKRENSHKLKLRLKMSTLRLIQLHPQWNFEFTNSITAFEELKSLYKEYLPNCMIPETPTKLISNLIRFCYTGDYRRYDPSLKMDSPLNLVNPSNFIGRKKDLDRLYKIIKLYKHTLISGSVGIGKTYFASYFAHCDKYSKNFHDICYIKYARSLTDTLDQLNFSISRVTQKQPKEELIKLINPDSLLIIDDVNDTEEQLCAFLSSLKNFPLNIVIISRTPHSFKGINTIFLKPLSCSSLLDIINTNQFKQKDVQDALNAFIKSTQYNTLCCASLSKALNHINAASIDTYLEFLETINSFYHDIKSEFKSVKYKLTYDHKELNYWGHIKSIEKTLVITDDDRTILYFLSFFGSAVLSTEYLIDLFDLTDIWFKEMIDYGIFIKKGQNRITLNPLISNAMFLKIQKSGVYTRFENYISKMNIALKQAIPNWEIAPALAEFIKHMNPCIKAINNIGQKKLSKHQKEWNDFIFNTLTFLANNNYPQETLSILKVFTASDSELLHNETDLGTAVFSIYASLLEGNLDDFSLYYEALVELIHNNSKASNYSVLANYLITIFIDHILLDIMRYENYTYGNELYRRYHILFLLIDQNPMIPELYYHYQFLDNILYYRQNQIFDLLMAYKNFLLRTEWASLQIKGLSLSITIYFRIITNLLDQNVSRDIIQDTNNHLTECKHILDKVINSVDQIAILDYSFALLAYSNYYILFISTPETYAYCETDMKLLFAKAPHANEKEFYLLLNLLLNLNHPTA